MFQRCSVARIWLIALSGCLYMQGWQDNMITSELTKQPRVPRSIISI